MRDTDICVCVCVVYTQCLSQSIECAACRRVVFCHGQFISAHSIFFVEHSKTIGHFIHIWLFLECTLSKEFISICSVTILSIWNALMFKRNTKLHIEMVVLLF